MKLKDLAKNLSNFNKRFPTVYAEGLKAAALAMGQVIIEDATPIRTGRLAHNWQPSRNQSGHFDSRATGNEQSAKAELKRKIKKFKLDENRPRLYLNNAAPYAFAKLERNKMRGAIRDPAVRQAVRQTIKEEFKKAMRGR